MTSSRNRAIAEAVQARTQHIAAERELSSLRALANSEKYGNLSDSAREKMFKRVKDAEERVAQKKSELNACVYKLVDNDFWDLPLSWKALRGEPKGKGKEKEPVWDAKETEAEERFTELRTVVWQVRDGVSELYKMMGDVRSASSSASGACLSADDQTTDDDKRPTKRRRTSDARVEDATSIARSSTLATSPAAPAPSVPTPDPALPASHAPAVPPQEVDEIMDRLYALDDRVADLENNMVQFDSEVIEELDRRNEDRFRAMCFGGVDAAPEETMDVDQTQGAGSEQPEGEGTPQKPRTLLQRLKDVEQDVQGAGREIYEIAVEIAQVIQQSRSQATEVERLTKENEELKTRVAEVRRLSWVCLSPRMLTSRQKDGEAARRKYRIYAHVQIRNGCLECRPPSIHNSSCIASSSSSAGTASSPANTRSSVDRRTHHANGARKHTKRRSWTIAGNARRGAADDQDPERAGRAEPHEQAAAYVPDGASHLQLDEPIGCCTDATGGRCACSASCVCA